MNNNQIIEENKLKDKINDIKKLINTLYGTFRTLEEHIFDLAKEYEKRKICETNEICNKIKKDLEEEIKNGKITDRWIEKCLPKEYKRKYEKKSEVSSLSSNDEMIVVTTDGTTSRKNDQNYEDLTISKITDQDNKIKEIDNKECLSCIQLEDSLKSNELFQSADKIRSELKIPKYRHIELENALKQCEDHIIIRFHGYENIVSIESDIAANNDNDINQNGDGFE